MTKNESVETPELEEVELGQGGVEGEVSDGPTVGLVCRIKQSDKGVLLFISDGEYETSALMTPDEAEEIADMLKLHSKHRRRKNRKADAV
jgi:hypothetical protein